MPKRFPYDISGLNTMIGIILVLQDYLVFQNTAQDFTVRMNNIHSYSLSPSPRSTS